MHIGEATTDSGGVITLSDLTMENAVLSAYSPTCRFIPYQYANGWAIISIIQQNNGIATDPNKKIGNITVIYI